MAQDYRTLKLEVLAETKQFVKGMNDANKQTQSFGSKIADIGKKAAVALAAAGAAAAAFAAKAVLVGEQAATANARIDQINKSMGLFGNSTSEVTRRLIDYAEATARSTGIDTNSIKATQAKLLTFKELAKSANELGGEFDRATQAAIDLAAAGFGSAETNAIQLGKALQDPIKGLTALSRSGVTFTEIEKDRIKALVESNKVGEAQRLILEAIEKQVGNTAEATVNASDKIRVGFTQVQERIGLALLPAFEKLTTFILENVFPAFEQKVLPVFKDLNNLFQNNLVPVIQNYLIPILEVLGQSFSKVSDAIKSNEGNLKSILVMFGTFVEFAKTYVIPIIKFQLTNAIEGLGNVFSVLFKVASPILGAIANLITGIINVIDKAIQGIINLVNKAVDGINAVLRAYNSIPLLPNVGLVPNISQSSTGMSGTGSNTINTQIPTITLPSATSSSTSPTAYSTPVVINVNSPSIIDQEGFTRAVIDALNDSANRGTGGAGSLKTTAQVL